VVGYMCMVINIWGHFGVLTRTFGNVPIRFWMAFYLLMDRQWYSNVCF